MPYEVLATSRTPALIIYVIDVSGSMDQVLDGQKKIEHVNQGLGKTLQTMVQRSTVGEIISTRYRLGIIAYSDSPIDVLDGVETISEVTKRGMPRFAADGSTDTCAAFRLARDVLKNELSHQQQRPAPLVCHVTDGEYTGNDPEPIAHEIMAMSTDDGNVLLENIFVGTDLLRSPIASARSWKGIHSINVIKDAYAKKLFRMSSALPKSYNENIENDGFSLQAGARMLFPCGSRALLELAFATSGATPTR